MTDPPNPLVGKQVIYKCFNQRREGVVTARDRYFVYIKFTDAAEPRAVSSKFVFVKKPKVEVQDDGSSTTNRVV